MVGLVWILRRVPSLSSKGKLSYAVVELLACLAGLYRLVLGGGRDFLGD